MQPALFVVGTVAEINFIHIFLEDNEIAVSASELCKVRKIQYKGVSKGRKLKVEHVYKKVNLQGCIFALPSIQDFQDFVFLKDFIIRDIELKCLLKKLEMKFYYNVILVDKLKDIMNFKSGDATFSSFLKAGKEFNVLIRDHS